MYIELHAKSAFSFLEGASVPEELIAACAGTSRCRRWHCWIATVSTAAPRFHLAAKKNGIKAHIGAEITVQSPTSNVQSQVKDQRSKTKGQSQTSGRWTLDVGRWTKPLSLAVTATVRNDTRPRPEPRWAIRIFAG